MVWSGKRKASGGRDDPQPSEAQDETPTNKIVKDPIISINKNVKDKRPP